MRAQAFVQQGLEVLGGERVVGVEAVRIGQAAATHEVAHLVGYAHVERREAGGGGSPECPHQRGRTVVQLEDAVLQVALVATEDLVAAVTRDQQPHTGTRGERRAVMGGDRRGVAERLVVGRAESFDRLDRIVFGHTVFVRIEREVARGDARVIELVVAGLGEADREAAQRGRAEFAAARSEDARDARAVGAARQERAPARIVLRRVVADGGHDALAQLGRARGIVAVEILGIARLPPCVDLRAALGPAQPARLPELLHVAPDARLVGDEREVQVVVDRLRVDQVLARQAPMRGSAYRAQQPQITRRVQHRAFAATVGRPGHGQRAKAVGHQLPLA